MAIYLQIFLLSMIFFIVFSPSAWEGGMAHGL